LAPAQITLAQGTATGTPQATAQATAQATGEANAMPSKKCLEGAADFNLFQTPVPVTPTVTPTAAPTNTPDAVATAVVTPTVPVPTPTLRPAPSTDNVGFPAEWEEFIHVGTFDRGPAGLVRIICFNDVAMTADPGGAFPNDSVIALITYRAKAEGPGRFALDENGHLIRETLFRVEAMRKQEGFGEAYGPFASGDWQYGSYNPDGSLATQPQNTGVCAACHLAGSNEDLDWTFFASHAFQGMPYRSVLAAAQSPVQLVHMVSMGYAPNNVTVKPGTVLVWDNQDFMDHDVTARDGSWESGPIAPGGTFSRIFTEPGAYPYFCTLHPAQMSGTVTVQ
jgi:plastocyanin